VSKSGAYQNYVHIAVCLARRYIPRDWTKIKMMFLPVPTLKGKAYCLTSLLQKMMQKLVIRNIKGETLQYVPYVYNKLPTN